MADGLTKALNNAGGTARRREGVSVTAFIASLTTAVVVFALEFLLFLILKGKLTRV